MKNKFYNMLLLAIPVFLTVSCEKVKRPALGDYPKDHTVTPTTALRFYVPFDSADATASQLNIRFRDSISDYPSYFPDKSITYTAGIKGTAFNNSSEAALQYLNTNDFPSSSSFSMSLWVKCKGVPQNNPQFVMSLPDKDYWHNSGIFLLFDHNGAGSTADSAAVTFAIKDNWFTYHNSNRIPKLYDTKWHHLVFEYDATTSKLTTYLDGVKMSWLTGDAITQAGLSGPLGLNPASVSSFVLGGWNKHVGISGPTDSWIESFKGSIDQFRLYNKVLSDAEVLALYTNKQ
jgi:hypothetical protein